MKDKGALEMRTDIQEVVLVWGSQVIQTRQGDRQARIEHAKIPLCNKICNVLFCHSFHLPNSEAIVEDLEGEVPKLAELYLQKPGNHEKF